MLRELRVSCDNVSPTQRSRDLFAYMSLILRIAERFGGHAWLNYDRAFRQEAAASDLYNWSMMRADLYNYYTAGTSAPVNRDDTPYFRRRDSEAVSFARPGEICRSWNRGRCTSQFATCNFYHVCDANGCLGAHPRICQGTKIARPAARRQSRSPIRSRRQAR